MALGRITRSNQKKRARSRKSPFPMPTPHSHSPRAGPSSVNRQQPKAEPDDAGDDLAINHAPGDSGHPPAGQDGGLVGNFGHPDPHHVAAPPLLVGNNIDLEHSLQNVKGLYFHCEPTGGSRGVQLPFVWDGTRTINPRTIMKGRPGLDIHSTIVHLETYLGKMHTFRVFFRLGEVFLANPGIYLLARIPWKGDVLVVRVGVREEYVSIISREHSAMAKHAARLFVKHVSTHHAFPTQLMYRQYGNYPGFLAVPLPGMANAPPPPPAPFPLAPNGAPNAQQPAPLPPQQPPAQPQQVPAQQAAPRRSPRLGAQG